MTLHIGIVACSAEGAALCYRTICVEGAAQLGPHGHPEVSMHTHSLAAYMDRIYLGDWPSVAELMLSSADKLARIGADFLICPDNTIHQALGHVVPRSPKPWLHIAEVVADEAVRRGFRRVGITGTRWLVDSEVYPRSLRARGLEAVRPNDAERDEINRIIMDELVCSVFKPESVAYFQQVIGRMKDSGCDAVALACTEIPLIIDDERSALPTLDSTRCLRARRCDGRSRADARRAVCSRRLRTLHGLTAQRLSQRRRVGPGRRTSASPTNIVGAPNTPRATASSVVARSTFLTSASARAPGSKPDRSRRPATPSQPRPADSDRADAPTSHRRLRAGRRRSAPAGAVARRPRPASRSAC